MPLRKSKLFPLFVVLLISLMQLSCIERKINFFTCKIIPDIGPGQLVYWEIRESVDVIIPPGKLTWNGNFDLIQGPLPGQVNFLIEHRAKGGRVLESWSLLVPVNPDGKIPKMSTTFPGAVLKAKERLRFNFSPVDDRFPGAQLNLRFKYNESNSPF